MKNGSDVDTQQGDITFIYPENLKPSEEQQQTKSSMTLVFNPRPEKSETFKKLMQHSKRIEEAESVKHNFLVYDEEGDNYYQPRPKAILKKLGLFKYVHNDYELSKKEDLVPASELML